MADYTESWAFFFIDKDVDPAEARTELFYSNRVRMFICGFNSVEEALPTAKRLAEEEGVDLIELCGGFGKEGARKIKEAAGGIMVGYASLLEE